MKKILVIGQAPALKKQTVPYDTTLLYEMLSWVGISKEQAQEMFEFEAMVSEFTGLNKANGHKPPTKRHMTDHFWKVLQYKIAEADKVILLGSVAAKFLDEAKVIPKSKHVIRILHPSRRNYSKIIPNKELITKQLNEFIWNNQPA